MVCSRAAVRPRYLTVRFKNMSTNSPRHEAGLLISLGYSGLLSFMLFAYSFDRLFRLEESKYPHRVLVLACALNLLVICTIALKKRWSLVCLLLPIYSFLWCFQLVGFQGL